MSISLVLGRRGSGKTTFIKSRLTTVGRLLLFDTLGEYGDCGEVVHSLPELLDLVERKEKRLFRIVYQPMSEKTDIAFSGFLQVSWIVQNHTIVIDEIDAVSSAISVPEELAKNLRYGRHRGIDVIAASRRAAEVPRLVTSQADEIVSFNQSEPRDIAYLRSFCGTAFSETVKNLKQHYHVIFKPLEPDIPLDPLKLPR